MLTLLNRIAWGLSLIIAFFLAYLVSDIFSSSYDNGAENLFSWGWMFGVVFLGIVKGVIFSRSSIEFACQNLGDITHSHEQSGTSPEIRVMPSDSTLMEKDSYVSATRPSQLDTIIATAKREANLPAKESSEPMASIPLEEERVTQPPKPNWIVVFFSDRPLAKIGGILLFLGALFFLSLIWSAIGAKGKILIGLIFGFFLYGCGVWMDKKGHTVESRTLLGVGISINTLTILSGRWIIGDIGDDHILSDSVTLIFLILNTLFAVVTALVYSSRVFLIFSFIFAYLIPFLIGAKSDGVILLLLYTFVVSLGGYGLSYFLSQREGQKDDATWLYHTVLIGSTVLMGLMGFSLKNNTELTFYTVLLLVLTGVATVLVQSIGRSRENLAGSLLSGYIMLLAGTLGFGETGNIFIYILGLVPLAIFAGVEIALFGITTFLSMFLFLPMIFGLILLGVFGIGSLVVILVPIMGLFLLTLFFLFPRLTPTIRAFLFLGIALFLGVGGIALDIHPLMISTVERAILSSSMLLTFVLLLWSGIRYHFSELSLPGMIGTVFLLSLILVPTWSASWIVYGVFLLIGFSYPFIAHIHGESSSRGSLIGYQIVLNLFLLGELFFLGNTVWFTNSSSSLITLGIIVFVLSLASLIYSVLLMRTVVFENDTSLKGLSQEKKATVSGILAIPLSLFSLAVAVTFSETPLVVSTVWILESSVLAYFFGKARNTYILLGSLVLLAIGLLRTVPFFDAVHVRDWLALVPIGITAVSIFLGARLLGERDRELTHAYDVLHIVGIITVASACMQIIPHTSFGWSLLGLSLVLGISTLWYQRIQSRVLAPWLVILGCSYFVYHIVRVQGLSLSLGAFFIQMIALFLAWYATWIYFVHSRLGKISFTFGGISTLLITSLYVHRITENVFAVTIYLTMVATIFLLYGINANRSPYRTIGLYIGVVILIKILFYDLWAGVDNLIIRVLALMISGAVMIGLSQLYGRQVSRSWSEEFSLENIVSSGEGDPEGTPPMAEGDGGVQDDMPFTETLANEIKTTSIDQISRIRLRDPQGNTVFESKRVGILRIVNYIVTKIGKNEFAPAELTETFHNVVPHIQSALPKKELDAILQSISSWIDSGGSIEIVKNTSKESK